MSEAADNRIRLREQELALKRESVAERNRLREEELRLKQANAAARLERDRLKAEELRVKKERAEERARLKGEELQLKSANLSAREARQAYRESKSKEFIKTRVLCTYNHIQELKEFAFGLAVLREQSSQMADIFPNQTPIDRASAYLYTLLCHPDDRQMLRDYGIELMNRGKPPVDLLRKNREIIAAIAAKAEEEIAESWPKHDPR